MNCYFLTSIVQYVAAGGEISYKWNDSHAAGSEGFQWYGFAGVSWKGEFCLAGDK
jgi:hypothetical protein